MKRRGALVVGLFGLLPSGALGNPPEVGQPGTGCAGGENPLRCCMRACRKGGGSQAGHGYGGAACRKRCRKLFAEV